MLIELLKGTVASALCFDMSCCVFAEIVAENVKIQVRLTLYNVYGNSEIAVIVLLESTVTIPPSEYIEFILMLPLVTYSAVITAETVALTEYAGVLSVAEMV